MRLKRLQAVNYRALAGIDVPLGPINILFGPNGAGKSTLLDTIWFVRDCAIRNVGVASSDRDHGIGLLYDDAPEGSPIQVALSTDSIRYELTFEFSGGRIEPLVGERLDSFSGGEPLIHRLPGTNRARLFHVQWEQSNDFELREPEKLSLNRYLDFTDCEEAAELDRILHFVRSYHSRSFQLYRLKKYGSESSYETTLWPSANNLWSVLRNLEAKRRQDGRYETIMTYMVRAFPRTFEALIIEQTGPNSLYAKFMESGRKDAILASGVSDGHIQLLILLTALFSEGKDRFSLLLIDEPETSLHPWALAVLAEAMAEAARGWNKQLLVATHSPVLLSQFDADQILTVDIAQGRSRLTRLNEIPETHDLLEQYAAGSLFMSGLIGNQSDGEVTHSTPNADGG